VPDEVSNTLITQSHDLAKLPTKLKNQRDISMGTNEGSATHDNRTI